MALRAPLIFFYVLFKHVWIGEKNNSKCIKMNTGDGTKEEESCDNPKNYICEKPAPGISKI